MGISASNIIVQGVPVAKDRNGNPIRAEDRAKHQMNEKRRFVIEPLIEHRESAFHSDMLHSNKDK